MSLLVAGTNLGTLGLFVSGRRGWYDSVRYVQKMIQLPGTYTWQHMGDDPKAQRRQIRVTGSVTASTPALLKTNVLAINNLVAQPDEQEWEFDDFPDLAVRGHGTIGYQELPPIQRLSGGHVVRYSLTIDCADPRRYDVSGGSPGVSVDTSPVIGAASSTHPLPS